jgi:hypothetical protein
LEFDLDDGIAVLERTPGTLRAMLAGLSPRWTDANEGPDTWSPHIIVRHLILGDQTDWIPRAEIILRPDGSKHFIPFDMVAHLDTSDGHDIETLLDAFATLRRDNIATLKSWSLTPAELELEGIHPEFGAVTLRQLLATWVAHDLGHIVQVARVMAKQYRGAVGPWRSYLSVMDR